MGNDVTSHARDAIINKRDALLRERRQIRDQRQQLSIRDRVIDRELADCRAAARLFNLDVEFPPDEQAEFMRIRAIENRLLHAAVQNAPLVASAQAALPLPATKTQSMIPGKIVPNMPRIRDIVLDRLREAGDKGEKAISIKHYIESTYGVEVHYKTVGMTLYRLSKEREGHVRRKGQTWFFVPSKAAMKNPGGGTPGNFNRG